MRLLRLQGPDAGPTLDLHPYVTVVSGLSGPARDQVIAALSALPSGTEPGMNGLVEAHGVLLDLDAATLELLDFDSDLDVVVRAADLDQLDGEPALTVLADQPVASAALATAQQTARDARAAYDILREALDELRASYEQAVRDHATLAATLASVRQAPAASTGAKGTRNKAADAAAESEPTPRQATALLEPGEVSPETEAELVSAVARVERVRCARDEVAAALEPLVDIDPTPVEAALASVHAAPAATPVPDPEAISLADELRAADEAVDAYDRRREAEGRGPEAARRRLDEAQGRLRDLEAALKPRTFDPADIAALEEAHEAVQAAEQKVSAARLSSKGLKKKLDEAVAIEEEILGRLGFATYTAFVMSTTSPSISPDQRARVEAAQVELVEAEAAFAEASTQAELDPERIALVNGAVAVREAAMEYVAGHRRPGAPEEPDLGRALRSLTVMPEGAGAEARAAIDGVRSALETVGVDFGDLELSPQDIVDVATVWISDMVEAAEERDRLLGQLDAAEAEVARAESDLAALETSAQRVPPSVDEAAAVDEPDGSDPTDLDDDVEEDIDLEALEAQVEEAAGREAELEERVDAQAALLEFASDGADAAEARLAALEGPDFDDEIPAEGLPDAPSEAAGVERYEWYLLARLASQRSVSYAGSVPLVIDEALLAFGDDDVDHLLGRLEKMADAVQVVYMSDDPRVWEWADRAGLDRAAVVQPY